MSSSDETTHCLLCGSKLLYAIEYDSGVCDACAYPVNGSQA